MWRHLVDKASKRNQCVALWLRVRHVLIYCRYMRVNVRVITRKSAYTFPSQAARTSTFIYNGVGKGGEVDVTIEYPTLVTTI